MSATIVPTAPMPAPIDPRRVYPVPMKEIMADQEFNCRGAIDPTTLMELQRSIAENGLQQPIILRPYHDPASPNYRYQVVAGFRRFIAHKILKAETVDSIIKTEMDEDEARLINLAENLQREDLNIKQEAHAISRLRFKKENEIARRLNKPLGWVQVRLALLSLPDDIQNEAAAGFFTGAQIRSMSRLNTKAEMYDFTRQIKDAKLKKLTREPDPNKVKANSVRLRTRSEIEEVQELIRQCYGSGIATRALAWASGYIDDLELHKTIAEDIEDYVIPPELLVNQDQSDDEDNTDSE